MTVTANSEVGAVVTRSNTMSLTYSDLVFSRNEYTELSEDEIREIRRNLPGDFKPIRETKVPLMQNVDAANQDFIIIAEFSELEGPVPLCTIPSDASEKTDIKLNDFVVHLMSTDYQVNTVGQFRICKDTQVIRKNVFPDAHVFMQYFTMYDIKARGFVRPFCFGYVSKDHIKLDKYTNFLIAEFDKVTSVLEHSNREWFANELKIYLDKLQMAKENFIQEHTSSSFIDNHIDEFGDPDVVTLAQIAHQYSEIQNILTTVQTYESKYYDTFKKDIGVVILFMERHTESNLSNFLKKNGIRRTDILTETCASAESLANIPFIHPLRSKGEPLRNLTVLGQLGTVCLVATLMQIYNSCKMDIIFTEMTEATISFRQHFENLRLTASGGTTIPRDASSSPGRSSGISADFNNSNSSSSMADLSCSEEFKVSNDLSPFELIQERDASRQPDGNSTLWLNLRNKELCLLMEKLHVYGPINSDNKSGSYHTVSEDDSDLNIPSQTDGGTDLECGASVDSSVPTSVNKPTDFTFLPPSTTDPLGKYDTSPSRRVTSQSSDDEASLTGSIGQDTTEETVVKEPWWIFASKKLVRGTAGYGLTNFFRRYHECAHHVLYSILLGRPIIICGEEKLSRKIGRIITALIPLVPSVSSHSSKSSWKLLRWHRGILVQAHIEAYRIIGLCIPEKLEVHDLIPPRLVTLVTILSADKKCILGGPAYSGDLLQNFEKKYQKHFYNCDVSLLSYIGGLYADIESKVYMYKTLQEKYRKSSSGSVNYSSTSQLFKELHLRASDIEIVRYLSSIISDPSDCVNLL